MLSLKTLAIFFLNYLRNAIKVLYMNNQELSRAIARTLTFNVPVLLLSDLQKSLSRLCVDASSFERTLARMGRTGMVITSVANLPSIEGWTCPLTQAGLSIEVIANVTSVSRTVSGLSCEPQQFVVASRRLLGLYGRTPIKLADLDKLVRYLRLGRAFAKLSLDSGEVVWQTAPPCKGKDLVIAKVTHSLNRPQFFIAPPAMSRDKTAAWLRSLITNGGQNVVC